MSTARNYDDVAQHLFGAPANKKVRSRNRAMVSEMRDRGCPHLESPPFDIEKIELWRTANDFPADEIESSQMNQVNSESELIEPSSRLESLEAKKLDVETKKLQVELNQLENPYSRPTFWFGVASVLSVLVGMVSIVYGLFVQIKSRDDELRLRDISLKSAELKESAALLNKIKIENETVEKSNELAVAENRLSVAVDAKKNAESKAEKAVQSKELAEKSLAAKKNELQQLNSRYSLAESKLELQRTDIKRYETELRRLKGDENFPRVEAIEAVRELRELGVTIRYDENLLVNTVDVTGVTSQWSDENWIDDLQSVRQFHDLKILKLPGLPGTPKITDRLEGLPVSVLDVSDSRISDSAFSTIASLRNLKTLDIDRTLTTDAGLAQLKGTPNLSEISVFGTAITSTSVSETFSGKVIAVSSEAACDITGTPPRNTDAGAQILRDSLKGVIGTDERYRIVETITYPFRTICYMDITWWGKTYGATGVVISKHAVLTSYTAISRRFDLQSGRFDRPEKVTVRPGRNLKDDVHGEFIASDLRLITDEQSHEPQFGIVFIDEPFPADLVPMQMKELDFESLDTQDVNAAGYVKDPRDGNPTLWWSRGGIIPPEAGQEPMSILLHEIDCGSGFSIGSPIWAFNGSRRLLIGIHHGSGPSGNLASPVTKEAIVAIQEFLQRRGDNFNPE